MKKKPNKTDLPSSAVCLKREPDKSHIAKKLLETIEFIESGKRVHITKMKSLNRINYYFGWEVFYEFARLMANNILKYYLSGNSLCGAEVLPRAKKEEILSKSVELINSCFGDFCDMYTESKIEDIFDQIADLLDSKRLYTHKRRVTLTDPDILVMKECLGFFIHNDEYPGFWKREYDIVKYYCVSYSDMRFRLEACSVSRIKDILEFVSVCLENENNKTG